jgi:hypothetical protein
VIHAGKLLLDRKVSELRDEAPDGDIERHLLQRVREQTA